ncbi:MAG: cupin domain-containing protein [Nocardioidaceae bacterium]
MPRRLHTQHRWDLEWENDSQVLALGHGVRVKVFRHDQAGEQVDMLIKFPPGYTEPEHTHASEHSVVVLEGLQIAEGEALRPGDYVYAPPDRPHGPFEYPEGCVVFASFRGGSSLHRYPGSSVGEG